MKPDEVSLKAVKMDLQLTQLLSLLNQETELYKAMLAVIEKEKDAAIRSALNALNEVIQEKERLIQKLRILEEHRIQVVRQLAEILRHGSQDLSLAMIARRIGEPYAGQLRQYSKNLTTLLDKVQAESRRNKTLFEHSLDLLRGSLGLLRALMASNTVYHRTGDIQNAHRVGQIVHGEI
jgi:flagellar biosynthesis/type III secretory pathway chaperone